VVIFGKKPGNNLHGSLQKRMINELSRQIMNSNFFAKAKLLSGFHEHNFVPELSQF
jgi:hypothetical protein